MDTPPDITEAVHWTVNFFIHLGTDFFAFFIIAGIVALFAFYFGRDRFMPLIAGIYAAIPLYQHFPYSTTLPTNPLLSLGLFVLLTLVGLIAFSGLSGFMAGGSVGFIKLIVLSVLTAGMLIAVVTHILPAQTIYTFSAPTLALFATPQSFFLWLAAPLAGIFFLGRG